jgi:hypothetical protein
MKRHILTIAAVAFSHAIVFSQGCLPEGITFGTQAEIDSFQINYPGCAEIEGNVTINGSDITNLNGLITLNSIGGNLTIGVVYGWNANLALEYLTGLENLVSIGGNLIINGNSILVDLSGLDNLSSAGGSLSISNNQVLNDISDLGSLNSIGGGLSLGYGSWLGYPLGNPLLVSLTGLEGITSLTGLQLIGNHVLTDLNGLNNLQSITGSIRIGGNQELTSLSGLDALTSTGGDLEIGYAGYYGWIGNPSLNDLTGLEGLLEIGGDLQFGGSDLVTLQGLNNLESIGNDLIFFNNGSIANLEGLDNLDFIGGNLLFGPYPGTGGEVWVVGGNSALIGFTGLEILCYIGGDLVIYGNSSLSSLSGIENLASIGGDLIIYDNDILSSISGIENIEAASIENLEIDYNNSLADCEIQSICNYLADPNGTVEIHDNAAGCNSPEEVEAHCQTFVEEIKTGNGITIFPNPSNEMIAISVPNGVTINEVLIYNQTGQKVLQGKPVNNTLDISNLQHGMYIIELITDQGKIREKLIVQ